MGNSNRMYDPPEGYLYGFPKPYLPLPGESLRDTLIRDGYPKNQADFAAEFTTFFGQRIDCHGKAI